MRPIHLVLPLLVMSSLACTPTQNPKLIRKSASSQVARVGASAATSSIEAASKPVQPSVQGTSRCAVVYRNDFALDSPVRAFCPIGDVGKVCDIHLPVQPRCDVGSAQWYQDAIYFAANRDSDGYPLPVIRPIHQRVYYTRGEIHIGRAQRVDFPFGSMTGIHLVSGVHLAGAPLTFGETVIRLDPNGTYFPIGSGREMERVTAADPLHSMVLFSNLRIFREEKHRYEHTPVTDASLSNVTITGAIGTGAIGSDVNTCIDVGDSRILVNNGVQAGASSGATGIQDVRIRQVRGNAIDLGVYTQWLPENPALSGGAQCLDFSCLGKAWKFSGRSPAEPNHVRWNSICAAGFGGITVIGDHVRIAENHISVARKSWTDASKSVGSTMGISAGFVGSSHIEARGNRIEGADYGIGTDGSVPLYLTIGHFQRYWIEIRAGAPESFKNRYPNGVPLKNGALDFSDVYDFLVAQQVLLDLAAKSHFDDELGFISDLTLAENSISGSTVGISLFKAKRVNIDANAVQRGPGYGAYGILISHSYDSYVYLNRLQGWETGISLMGRPGALSRWGASYNGIGVKYDWADTWTDLGNTLENNRIGISLVDAGYDNSLRNNQVSGSRTPCDLSGALRQSPQNDWTTGNSEAACNRDY